MTEHVVEADGERVAVAVGDEVVIRLPEPATGGFAWSVGELADGVEIVSADLSAASKMPGAAAHRTVRLSIRRPSEGLVTLVLGRPWEGAEPPVQRFSFSLNTP